MDASTVPPLALAVVQGHAIFLDVAADRYFALSPIENDAVLDLLGGRGVSSAARHAITAAIGIPAVPEGIEGLMPDAITPAHALTSTSAAPGGARDRYQAIRHLAMATAVLKLRGLQASLERLARTVSRCDTRTVQYSTDALARIVGAHEWLSRHLTANNACLVRSLALARHVRAAGLRAELVIGVRADPFAAHCWVQSGQHILNEDPDAVDAFQPILVVR